MRAIAEETFAMVRGTRDRIPASTVTASLPSRVPETMFGKSAHHQRISGGQAALLPECLLNPGNIVDPPKWMTARCFAIRRTTASVI